MWDQFTESARRAVSFATEEAAALDENFVGAEHILLGLIREEGHVAARVLERLNVSRDQLRADVGLYLVRGHGHTGQSAQLSMRGKRAVDLAQEEARLLDRTAIGTGHLLLGLLREGKGLAARVLQQHGIELERSRREVAELQDEEQ